MAPAGTTCQFAPNRDPLDILLDTVIDAHAATSQQALDSAKVRDGLRDVLLGPGELYEGLRGRAGREPAPA